MDGEDGEIWGKESVQEESDAAGAGAEVEDVEWMPAVEMDKGGCEGGGVGFCFWAWRVVLKHDWPSERILWRRSGIPWD